MNTKINKKEFIYFIGLVMLSLLNWEYFSTLIEFPDIIKKIITIISIICFLFVIMKSRFSPKLLFKTLVVTLFFTCASIMSKEYFILLSSLAVFSARDIKKDKIIKVILCINTFFIIMHFLLYYTGVIVNKKVYTTYLGGTNRQALNFRHPNYLAAVLFWNLACYVYVSKSSKIFKLFISFVNMFLMYVLTYSRTTTFLFILLIFCEVFENKIKNKLNHFKLFILILIALQIFITYKCSIADIYNNNILNSMNEILSQRLYLNIIALQNYGLTIFGHILSTSLNDIIIVDSFYISCIVQYGIIILLLIILGYIKLNNKDAKKVIYMSLVLFAGLTERYILFTSVTFPILFLGDCLLKGEYNEKK